MDNSTRRRSYFESGARDNPSSPKEEPPLVAKNLGPPKNPPSSRKVHPVTVSRSIHADPKIDDAGDTVERETMSTRMALLQLVFGFMVCVCLAWTLWLILLMVAPNDTVNRVMSTENFDNGSFWLLVDPPPALVALAVFGLSVVALGYLFVLAKMFMWIKARVYLVQPSPDRLEVLKDRLKALLDGVAANPTRGQMTSNLAKTLASLVRSDSSARKQFNLLLKVGDLGLELAMLFQVLSDGSPVVLVATFTTIVALNALVCAAVMFLPYERMGLVETLIDAVFALLIAVGYPMLVLLYCFSTFDFDREKLAINMEVFPLGWFEQSASVIADPMQTAVIYKSLKSLRIDSMVRFFTRVGTNLALWIRFLDVVGRIHNPAQRQISVYPKRHGPAACFFVCFAIIAIVISGESVRTSMRACEPHPECAVISWRWMNLDSGSLTQCPCLTLIDGDAAIRTYEEWMQPKNVTEKVAQLATPGKLETVQLIGRYLPVLPEELRGCSEMTHLALYYTHTETLPPWMKEFTKLEYLHLESKFTSSVTVMPNDMFDDMSSLTFIHFAAFMSLNRLPSFAGLTNLKSLTLAVFLGLEELPAFDTLFNLERLVIASVPLIDSLPDFSALKKLKAFAASDRGT